MASIREEMIKKLRERMKSTGFQRDPNEFRPPIAKPKEELRVRFFILPPLAKGDQTSTGPMQQSMDSFYLQIGDHWINQKPYPCPRVYDGEQCEFCNTGFALIKEIKEHNGTKEETSPVSRLWLPQTKYRVNVYFPKHRSNPDDLQGINKFFDVPKTVYDKFEECVMRDGPGDDEERLKPFGMFFYADEECTIPGGFPFDLEIKKKGEYNSYETSSFFYGNGPVPLVALSDGSPDFEKIEVIMNNRHDLISKCKPRDAKELASLAEKALGAKDSGSDAFEDEAPAAPTPKPVSKVSVKMTKPTPKPTPVIIEETEETESSEVTETETEVEAEVVEEPVVLAKLIPKPVAKPTPPVAKVVAPTPAKPVAKVPTPVAKPAVKVAAEPVESDIDDAEINAILSDLRKK